MPKAVTRLRERSYIVTFWAKGKGARPAVSLKTMTIKTTKLALARKRAKELPRPPGCERVTVAMPSMFGRIVVNNIGVTNQVRVANAGDIIWIEGDSDPARSAAAKLQRRIVCETFYALNGEQILRGDDVSACERIRLTRITVVGDREKANAEAAIQDDDDTARPAADDGDTQHQQVVGRAP